MTKENIAGKCETYDYDLEAEERRYNEVIAERAMQLQNGELNCSRLQIKRGEIAEIRFRYAKAEPLYRKALETRERLLGEDHPLTTYARSKLESNLKAQADDEAIARLVKPKAGVASCPA